MLVGELHGRGVPTTGPRNRLWQPVLCLGRGGGVLIIRNSAYVDTFPGFFDAVLILQYILVYEYVCV